MSIEGIANLAPWRMDSYGDILARWFGDMVVKRGKRRDGVILRFGKNQIELSYELVKTIEVVGFSETKPYWDPRIIVSRCSGFLYFFGKRGKVIGHFCWTENWRRNLRKWLKSYLDSDEVDEETKVSCYLYLWSEKGKYSQIA